MIDFAKKLKGLRKTREWSQDELAKRLGISRSTIGNYEQGIREPDFKPFIRKATQEELNLVQSYNEESNRDAS